MRSLYFYILLDFPEILNKIEHIFYFSERRMLL